MMKESQPKALAEMTKGGAKVDINEIIERRWEERNKHQEEARRRMRTGWKTDPEVLDEYFKSVVTNWKSYRGPKTEEMVCKMYGIYKQAVFGDCNVPNTYDILTLGNKKWQQWNSRKGLSKDESKRRFITFCAEIDPMLIDVMPNELPPEGFPCDNKGIPICAKCNTVVGCSRPLLDEHFENLRRQLFERAELQNPVNLRSWMGNALKVQRCIWGVHKPISKAEANTFSEWFNRAENKGFYPYDSKNLMLMVRDLLSLLYEILHDMQKNKDKFSIEDVNGQIMKVYAMDKYYTDFSGDKFVFEAECLRDDEICNKRREGDGGRNHKHPVEIEPPEVDYAPFEDAIILRKKCQALGINPATGVQLDITKRCEMYREKIREYEQAQEAIVAARKRNEMRAALIPVSKFKIKSLSGDLLTKHMINACNENDKAKILSLGDRGCSCDVETARGMRPLTVVQINAPTNDELGHVLKCRGANVNAVNRYGMSALMLACRMKETKTILYYMENAGADEAVSGGLRGLGRTALHYCAIHNSEEATNIIFGAVKKKNDLMRTIKFIDAQDSNGDTALIAAAKVGNGIMCRTLILAGANPIIKNSRKRTAAIEAKENSFDFVADWLSTKVAAGVSGVETVSDIQFEKTARFQTMQVMSMIADFSRATLNVLLGRPTGSVFATPSQTKQYVISNGEYGRKDQQRLVNSYRKFVLNCNNEDVPEEIRKHMDEMRSNMSSMMEILRQGEAYLSTEMTEKPIPWTPLMCACCLNDLRSMRLLKAWGVDPNYQNRHGTTALMLAAQLNNVDAIAELLHIGADVNVLDNEGFSALAYATSLPLPSDLHRSSVHVICDGEQGSGSKAYRSDEVLKLSLTHTPAEVKDKVLANKKLVEREVTTKFKPHLKLLEKQGLTTVDTIEDLNIALKRARQEDTFMDNFQDEMKSLHEKNIGTRPSIDSLLKFDVADSNHDGTVSTVSLTSDQGTMDVTDLVSETEEQVVDEMEVKVFRCPLCTLKIPCKHFFNKDSYDHYKRKKETGEKNYTEGSALGYENDMKKREAEIHRNRITRNVFNREGMKVLREAELDDRKTNRSDRYVQYMNSIKTGQVDKATLLNPFSSDNGGNIDNRKLAYNANQEEANMKSLQIDIIQEDSIAPESKTEETHSDSRFGEVISNAQSESEKINELRLCDDELSKMNHGDIDDVLPLNPYAHVKPADSGDETRYEKSRDILESVSTDTKLPSFTGNLSGKGAVNELATVHIDKDPLMISKDSEMSSLTEHVSTASETRPVIHEQRVLNPEVKTAGHDISLKESDVEGPLSHSTAAGKGGGDQYVNEEKDSVQNLGGETSSEVKAQNAKPPGEVDVKETDGVDVDDCYKFTTPLPPPRDGPLRSVLVKTYKSARKRALAEKHIVRKFQPLKRVIKFKIDDEILNGGIGAEDVKVSDVVLSSYKEALNENFTSRVDAVLSDDDESFAHKVEMEEEKKDDETVAKEALHTLLVGSKNEEDHDAPLPLFGDNPVPLSKRSVSMFTQPKIGAVSLDTDVKDDPMVISHIDNTLKIAEAPRQQNTKFLAVRPDLRLNFSGWIFSGLYSLDVAKKPIDTVCVESDNWRLCLNQLNDSFRKEWMPNYLRMECLVDIDTWKVTSQPCSKCMIGFVRYRAKASIPDEDDFIKDVCLACFSRKKLYESVVRTMPRSARKMFLFEWPFHVIDEGVETFSDDEFKARIMKCLRGYSASAAAAKVDTTFDPSRIMESKIDVNTLEMSEVKEEEPPVPEIEQKDAIVKYYKTAKARDDARIFMTMVKTGEVAPIVVEEQNKANLFEKKKKIYAGARKVLDASEVQVKSITLTDQYSAKDRLKIQPSEIPLLHVLLSNNNYEEVERVCRICLALEEYGGEAGVLYMVTLGILQSEMYKMLGLWVLALAVYVDVTDLLVSRLGFDDRLSIDAFCNIDLLFRRLDMSAAGKLYISTLVARIKKHSYSDNLRKSETVDAILSKYSQMLRQDHLLTAFASDMDKVFKPKREIWAIGYDIYGAGSLIKLLSWKKPCALIAKEAFIDYCSTKKTFNDDDNNMKYFPFVKFCDDYLKMWNCTHQELYRLLLQRLIKRYLSVLSASENIAVAEVYENISTEENHKKVQEFLQEGLLVKPEIFLPILEFCLTSLLKPYRAFVGTKMGESVRVHMLGEDTNAEFMHVIVAIIQNKWRCFRAKRKVNVLRKAKAAAPKYL